jgi:type II secretory pathway component PulF
MPEYQFEAMDPRGQEIKDVIEAATQDEAQAAIRSMGYFVTKISTREAVTRQRVQEEAFDSGCGVIALAMICGTICGLIGLGLGWAMGSFLQGLGFGIIGMLAGVGLSMLLGLLIKPK